MELLLTMNSYTNLVILMIQQNLYSLNFCYLNILHTKHNIFHLYLLTLYFESVQGE